MFDSKVDKDGKEITADGKPSVMVGERVMDNVLSEVSLSEDKKRIIFAFKQTNRAVFNYSFFGPGDPEGEYYAQNMANLKKSLLHIATKIVTEEEFWTAITGATTFEEFANSLISKIYSKGIGSKFNLKIVYSRKESGDYPSFPRFPNFIEKGNSETSTFSTNAEYDFYKRSSAPVTPENPSTEGTTSADIF